MTAKMQEVRERGTPEDAGSFDLKTLEHVGASPQGREQGSRPRFWRWGAVTSGLRRTRRSHCSLEPGRTLDSEGPACKRDWKPLPPGNL